MADNRDRQHSAKLRHKNTVGSPCCQQNVPVLLKPEPLWKSMLARWINRIFRKFGYQISKVSKLRRGFSKIYLRQLCQPKTVIDVGVGQGTPGLYHAYRTAKFILAEPLRENEGAINKILQKYDAIVYYKALGSSEGTMEIGVDTSFLAKSSFKIRTPLSRTGNKLVNRQVEVTTLDAIFREHPDLAEPILIKIDTEGSDLEVLQGGGELLNVADMVIVEVSINRRFEAGYGFEDVILYMKQKGFYVYDFLSVYYAGEELRPRYTDVVFKNTRKEGTPA